MSYTSPFPGTNVLVNNVVLSLEAAQFINGKLLALKEVTGNYNAVSNPKGFGTPNVGRVDVNPNVTTSGIVMEIQRPNDNAFEFGLSVPLSFIQDEVTPNANVFTIKPEDIGYEPNTIFPDGIYTVRYLAEVYTNQWIQPITKYILLAHNAKAKVYNCLANIDTKNCCTSSDTTQKALNSYAMYKSMLYNAAMGNIDKANELLECINTKGCGCGC
jgi:hypothetical protein